MNTLMLSFKLFGLKIAIRLSSTKVIKKILIQNIIQNLSKEVDRKTLTLRNNNVDKTFATIFAWKR
jgi:hypothetical protein